MRVFQGGDLQGPILVAEEGLSSRWRCREGARLPQVLFVGIGVGIGVHGDDPDLRPLGP